MTQQEIANAASQESQPPLGPSQSSADDSHWWQVTDFLVFGVWVTLIAIILPRHEPWADESQAWLIARDLDLRTIWFHELRYEGTPGLWHTILWIAQHWFHASYAGLSIIGAVCAAAGVAFILWKSPFPRPLTYLMVFSYFLVYQYAIVARSYNLLPLLVFAAAYLYRDRSRPVLMTIVLILLANVAVHGALLAASLGFCYLIEAHKDWPNLTRTVRARYFFCVGAMLLTFLFLFFILRPTPDVVEFAKSPAGSHPYKEPLLTRLDSVVAYAFFDQAYISALFLLLTGAWCFMRHKLLPFALSVSLLILLYVAVHGRPHHHGTVFLAAMAGLWIAWPTNEEMQGFTERARLATWGMITALACLFCLNIWDAQVSMTDDYIYPYSGSENAARFLKRMGADKTKIFGYTYGISAVQAYFDHNIVANSPNTYYHQGMPQYGAFLDFDEIQAGAPEYVIVFGNAGMKDYRKIDPPLRAHGYALVHYSEGVVFYKRSPFDTASYYIYQRQSVPALP